MSLGLVSPILNRGVRSRWVSTLPAGSKMLTIDAAGDVSYTDIPTAAWGSITGTLSSQTDLQNALNAKLSLSGGTVTGQLTNALGTITASTPLTLTQTWNNAAVTFTGALVNVTDTASNASSLLMDLQVGGSSKVSVRKDGRLTVDKQINSSQSVLEILAGGAFGISIGSVVWCHKNTLEIGGSADVDLNREAADTLSLRRSTNPQTFRVYNTYTDASNYERAKIAWESNVLRIGTEKAGTGSARALELQTDGTTRLTVASASPTVTIGTAVGTGILQFGVNTTGDLKVSSASLTQLSINQRGEFGVSSSVDGQWRIAAWNATNPILCFQGTTSSFPAIKRNGTAINFRLADDSADAGITASTATFSGNVTVSAVNIVTDTTTGTKIGTATTQKIGFYNKTPVVQPAAVADATDAASVITQLNLLLSRMRDLGLIAT